MDAPPAGISEADWLTTPVAVRALILVSTDIQNCATLSVKR